MTDVVTADADPWNGVAGKATALSPEPHRN
jgi:hypothetical protein